MAAPRATVARTLEWARRNIGTGPNRVRRWTRQAGLSGFAQWCGIFLGSALRAQGIKPPSGYPAAINWSNYGARVSSLADARPGDILVYGSHHVAMYLGGGRQIQGNDADGTVGESGVGASLGLGPITAIRRPPYRDLGKEAEIREHEDLGSGGLGLPGEEAFEKRVAGPADDVVGGAIHTAATAKELTEALLRALEDPESFLLTAALLGGGAFLIYYGAARLFGVHRPFVGPLETTARVATP